jgi:hypothetical protein
MDNHYDVIVIGAGVAGMATAAMLVAVEAAVPHPAPWLTGLFWIAWVAVLVMASILAKIVALRPYAIILDSSEALAASGCTIGALLQRLPTVKIICLDPKEREIQIVTSEQRQAGKALELLEMIEQAA